MNSSQSSNAGRPAILDAAMKGQVVMLLRSGCSKRRAAGYVGVAESTIRQAEKQDAAFAAEVARATLHFEVDLVTKLRAQAEKSWRAAAWLLERRLPEEFGQPPRRAREAVPKTDRELLEEVMELHRD